MIIILNQKVESTFFSVIKKMINYLTSIVYEIVEEIIFELGNKHSSIYLSNSSEYNLFLKLDYYLLVLLV